MMLGYVLLALGAWKLFGAPPAQGEEVPPVEGTPPAPETEAPEGEEVEGDRETVPAIEAQS